MKPRGAHKICIALKGGRVGFLLSEPMVTHNASSYFVHLLPLSTFQRRTWCYVCNFNSTTDIDLPFHIRNSSSRPYASPPSALRTSSAPAMSSSKHRSSSIKHTTYVVVIVIASMACISGFLLLFASSRNFEVVRVCYMRLGARACVA